MSFNEWKRWMAGLPWSCKWFVLFILVRPITDNFYSLKDISPIYSPLYIMGVLTPVFIFLSFTSSRFPARKPSVVDLPLGMLGGIAFVNCVLLLIFHFSLDVLGTALKCLTPLLMFFYLRRFIRSKDDLMGILQTFLYSCIFPFAVLLYENLFDPIAIEYLSEGRGGGSRIRGGYADVMSYAIFIISFFLITSYYYLVRIYEGRTKMNINKMLLAVGLCLLGLFSIKQVSTWAVFIVLFLLFLMKSVRNTKGVIFGLLMVLLVLPFFAQRIYQEQIQPLIEKEIAVANGEKDIEFALNGRVGRWEKYLAIWSALPAYIRVAGVSTSGIEESTVMVGGGIHNDFIRIMFLSGLAGLIIYLLFLLLVLKTGRRARAPEKYLITGAVVAIMLHSLSALPLLYASYTYLLVSVFAFAALPEEAKYGLAVRQPSTKADILPAEAGLS